MSNDPARSEKGTLNGDVKSDVEDEVKEELLPPPASASASTPAKSRQKYSTAAIIPVWIVLSSAVIIYNNYIYNELYFKYPVFLVTWHLVFAVRIHLALLSLRLPLTYGEIGNWHACPSADDSSS